MIMSYFGNLSTDPFHIQHYDLSGTNIPSCRAREAFLVGRPATEAIFVVLEPSGRNNRPVRETSRGWTTFARQQRGTHFVFIQREVLTKVRTRDKNVALRTHTDSCVVPATTPRSMLNERSNWDCLNTKTTQTDRCGDIASRLMLPQNIFLKTCSTPRRPTCKKVCRGFLLSIGECKDT